MKRIALGLLFLAAPVLAQEGSFTDKHVLITEELRYTHEKMRIMMIGLKKDKSALEGLRSEYENGDGFEELTRKRAELVKKIKDENQSLRIMRQRFKDERTPMKWSHMMSMVRNLKGKNQKEAELDWHSFERLNKGISGEVKDFCNDIRDAVKEDQAAYDAAARIHQEAAERRRWHLILGAALAACCAFFVGYRFSRKRVML